MCYCKTSILLAAMLMTGAAARTGAAQSPGGPSDFSADADSASALPDAPLPGQNNQVSGQPSSVSQSEEGKQTRRILWIIPNFRSVSADQKLPPLAPGEKFKLMIEDSFDYSSVVYVGLLAGIGQAENSYPEFHHGAAAFGRYYWHSYTDTVNGNLMTEYLFPVATKEDPRYYTLGHGGFTKRTVYAVGRLFVTRTDSGARAPNISEIVGNGSAAGISNLYYPSQERTWTKTGQRWAAQVGLDGVSNLIKEFWPDINSKFFHNKY